MLIIICEINSISPRLGFESCVPANDGLHPSLIYYAASRPKNFAFHLFNETYPLDTNKI